MAFNEYFNLRKHILKLLHYHMYSNCFITQIVHTYEIIGFLCLVGFLTSSSASRLSRGRALRLTCHKFTCCHTETEWRDPDFCLSLSLLYCHRLNQWGAGGRSLVRTHVLLTRSRSLYRLRNHALLPQMIRVNQYQGYKSGIMNLLSRYEIPWQCF